MNSDPAIIVSINLKIQNQEFNLTKEDAYSIYNQLHKALGISEPWVIPQGYPYYTYYPSYPTVWYTVGSSTAANINWKTS